MEPELAGDVLPDVLDKIKRHRKTDEEPLQITIDTRERVPWAFTGMNVEATVGTLSTGDYSVPGTSFCIERKSAADFLASISWGRTRFEKELSRMQAAGGGAIVVDATLAELLTGGANTRGDGTVRVYPASVLGTVAAFQARHGIPTYFAGARDLAERLAYHLLRQAVRQAEAEHES